MFFAISKPAKPYFFAWAFKALKNSVRTAFDLHISSRDP
jgi:hypothetical protein